MTSKIKKKTRKKTNLLEKELDILRKAIEYKKQENKFYLKDKTIKNIFQILESFLKKKQLVCYGGTAINNILPISDQFYDKNIDLPDYDFFSPNALNDAKELANIYYNEGFDEVEAKSGVHEGTYKVYVNFIPVADITELDSNLFTALQNNAIIKKGIYYAPANFLRMSGYLELSRPDGDISRWEKVWGRLRLLNQNYPILNKKCAGKDLIKHFKNPFENFNKIHKIVFESVVKQKLVFFGGYALYSYAKHMNNSDRKNFKNNPDFDVLSIDPLSSANIIKNNLIKNNVNNVTIQYHKPIGEIISEHYEIKVDDNSIIFLYKTNACHSYNTIKINNKVINIASIDTMLSLYLAFLYANRTYYDTTRILCISQFIFNLQIKNRLSQKGILKRFTTKCYGNQQTLEDIKANKSFIYNELKNEYRFNEYQKHFFRYIPTKNKSTKNKSTKNKSTKNKSTKNKSTKNKSTKNKSKKHKSKKHK